jgi:glycosyltransferase involved in cell wall biosynthesis
MPVGIDTDSFKHDSSIQKKPNSILFLGRIASVKNVDLFIEALKKLRDDKVRFSATIAGSYSGEDAEYGEMICDRVLAYSLNDRVTFTGAVSRLEALKLYREHELYVNLTPSGSMDKTIFEALASGSKVLVSNAFFKGKLPKSWIVTDSKNLESLVLGIKNALINSNGYSPKDQEEISDFLEEHSLKNLMKELLVVITTVVSKKTDEINLHNI